MRFEIGETPLSELARAVLGKWSLLSWRALRRANSTRNRILSREALLWSEGPGGLYRESVSYTILPSVASFQHLWKKIPDRTVNIRRQSEWWRYASDGRSFSLGVFPWDTVAIRISPVTWFVEQHSYYLWYRIAIDPSKAYHSPWLLIGRVKRAIQPLEGDFPLFPEISDKLILILLYSIFIASYLAGAGVAIMTTKRPPTMPTPPPPPHS